MSAWSSWQLDQVREQAREAFGADFNAVERIAQAMSERLAAETRQAAADVELDEATTELLVASTGAMVYLGAVAAIAEWEAR